MQGLPDKFLGDDFEQNLAESLRPVNNINGYVQQQLQNMRVDLSHLQDDINREVMKNIQPLYGLQELIQKQVLNQINSNVRYYNDGSSSIIGDINSHISINVNRGGNYYTIVNSGNRIFVTGPDDEVREILPTNGFIDLRPYTGQSFRLNISGMEPVNLLLSQ